MKKFNLLFIAIIFIAHSSCKTNDFDSTKIEGRYRFQFESEFKDQEKGGVLEQLFNRTFNASVLETTFDGNATAVNHLGNDVVGVGLAYTAVV